MFKSGANSRVCCGNKDSRRVTRKHSQSSIGSRQKTRTLGRRSIAEVSALPSVASPRFHDVDQSQRLLGLLLRHFQPTKAFINHIFHRRELRSDSPGILCCEPPQRSVLDFKLCTLASSTPSRHQRQGITTPSQSPFSIHSPGPVDSLGSTAPSASKSSSSSWLHCLHGHQSRQATMAVPHLFDVEPQPPRPPPRPASSLETRLHFSSPSLSFATSQLSHSPLWVFAALS